MAKITAVIDIGSNSITLKIYKKTSRLAFYELHRLKYKIKIGEGSYENGGVLQTAPMQRAFEALKDFSYIIKAYKARKTLCVATSALRDAPNKKEFIKRVDCELGIKIKVIDGDKESEFGAISAINLLPKMDTFTTIDIGGGSTEFAKVVDGKVVKTTSLQLGHVRLSEKFKSESEKLEYIESELDKLDDDFFNSTVVAIGGSARELSKFIQKKEGYPLKCLHGYRYDFKNDKKYLEELLEYDEKKLKKYISKSRIDSIKDGDLIFLKSLEKLGCCKVIVNQKGLREGVYLKDLLRSFNSKFPANFDLNLKVIEDRFIETPKVNNYLKRVALSFLDAILEDNEFKKEIAFCAKVLNILDFNFYSWIEYLDFGITHEKKVLIAYLLHSFNEKELDEELYEKYILLLPSFDIVKKLFYLLELVDIIGKNMLIQKFDIVKSDNIVEIVLEDISSMSIDEIERLDNPTIYKIKVKSGRKSI